ncbi:triose-phosphate isomerase [Gilvimarinus algae]|uniref:Triosephosphate isomerase n=1 Tax=Gilvimarinus algae TaxID=3058037 RepID=A0ABT8TAQ7_9GAMM|nr:triose-phosphate isomerase [Gilvimarinus sp. SDUM040014]MDO3381197.1 triose-phosphate isomerase [Gilvimarinus sp. SDUM040014]
MASQPQGQRRRLVVGNWKMNGTREDNTRLLQGILGGWTALESVDVAICPAFVHIPQVAESLKGSQLHWGGQSTNPHEAGAYTGEVSAAMLADLGCRYVIIGHNERRRLRGETDDYVAEQFLAVQRAGLVPILCVGETIEQRESGQALATIGAQLDVVRNAAGLEAFEHAVVAYEPIWAVGTGKTATPDEAEQVHAYIREQFGELGRQLTILYGGSVKSHNAAELFQLQDIDGALLGGASLEANEFLAICRHAEQAGKRS